MKDGFLLDCRDLGSPEQGMACSLRTVVVAVVVVVYFTQLCPSSDGASQHQEVLSPLHAGK